MSYSEGCIIFNRMKALRANLMSLAKIDINNKNAEVFPRFVLNTSSIAD